MTLSERRFDLRSCPATGIDPTRFAVLPNSGSATGTPACCPEKRLGRIPAISFAACAEAFAGHDAGGASAEAT